MEISKDDTSNGTLRSSHPITICSTSCNQLSLPGNKTGRDKVSEFDRFNVELDLNFSYRLQIGAVHQIAGENEHVHISLQLMCGT